MYNRYVPTGDGSYRRSRVPEPPRPTPRRPPPKPCPPEPAPEPPKPCPPPADPCPPPKESCPPPRPKPCGEPPRRPAAGSPGILDFFRRLLPRGLETGDLIVILLLLLIAGDSPDDQNTALLTLALYLFL